MPTPDNTRVSTGSDYAFTASQDWFTSNIDIWRNLFPLITTDDPRVLEIGSWEGRSAVFLLNELCVKGGSIVCVDHFDLLRTEAGRERHRKVWHNLTLTGKPFRVMESFSFPALMKLLEEEMNAKHVDHGFDWIYIDGSHEADDTFLDAELGWRLAKPGAVVIFDDYLWDKEPAESIHHPKRGVDAFMLLHKDEFDILSSPMQYQMILRKTSNMRIGFLLDSTTPDNSLTRAFGYDIHIALTIDSNYAMPAAVVIRSVAKHTRGRITFYLVDLGIVASDKDKLEHIVADLPGITLVFLSLPDDLELTKQHATWAKISMLQILPVERVLYLDADVLVRRDLRALWETDLLGKPLGAVMDVGHPMGHAGVPRGPYFNAGVLLLDLALVRGMLPDLNKVAIDMQDSLHKDQDALNIYFQGAWHAIDLKWNAQGLGTYADGPSPERAALNLEDLKDASIVHYTGPVNPGVAEVLNPFVQPYTAKPWGYAGAPGHPFADDWWTVLEETPWRGWRSSLEFASYKDTMREMVIKDAKDALSTRTAAT